MRARAVAVPLIVCSLGLASCGSSSSIPTRSYTVAMAAMPGAFLPMDTRGSASVTIRVIGSRSELCWVFRGLTGVADPTRAAIHAGDPGEYGSLRLTLGAHYTASGCTSPVAAAQLRAIVADPTENYLELDSRAYAVTGAIRGQL
jgi:hypothetical protein